jgi:hypothetical protein
MPAYSEAEYSELFERLVPADGKCETVEGEILRAASRIHYDYTNNGFGNNWSGALHFLAQYLGLTEKELEILKPYARGRVAPEIKDMFGLTDPILTTCDKIVNRAVERAKRQAPPSFPDMFDLQDPDFTQRELVEMGDEADGEE